MPNGEEPKPNDFGGISYDKYNEIKELVKKDPAAEREVLTAMIAEKFAAINPGDGRTGIREAYKAFDELDNAALYFQAKGGDPKEGKNARDRLVRAIGAIELLWKHGLVTEQFYSSKKK